MPARSLPSANPTFLRSDHRLARAAQPLVRFLEVEVAGGVVLIAAAVVALVWANVWPAGYESVWSTEVHLAVGDYELDEDLRHIVNDLLMALFFFVVGMEIKRELIVGELRDRRALALPAMAALGGMLVPALLYAALNAGGAGSAGWGIPMATDVAFALGVVALLGSRVPASIKVLLLTLAIVDDIGAIVVIAVFYSSDVDLVYLVGAAVVGVAVAAFHRLGVTYPPVLVALGLLLWWTVFESGVHATIAGVVMGLLTPAVARQSELEADDVVDVLAEREDLDASDVRMAAWTIRNSVSACDRLIESLHPWTSLVIVPLFALANAGVALGSRALTNPSSIFAGVLAGLVVGKLVGVAAFSWVAVRLRIARLPDGARWGHIVGLGAVAGIGFTVSLFITGLAFDDASAQADAKLATLAASVIAAIIGAIVFERVHRKP